MGITKLNEYAPGVNNNLTNLVQNVGYNRLTKDKVICEISGSDLLIKVGSLIESNGAIWEVENSDLSVTLEDGVVYFDDSTGNYVIIDDEPVFYENRAGFYREGSNEKATRWQVINSQLYTDDSVQYVSSKGGIRKVSSTLDIIGKLLFSGARGAVSNEGVTSGVKLPSNGLTFVDATWTGNAAAEVSGIGGDIDVDLDGGLAARTSWIGLVPSDGSMVSITSGPFGGSNFTSYKTVEVG